MRAVCLAVLTTLIWLSQSCFAMSGHSEAPQPLSLPPYYGQISFSERYVLLLLPSAWTPKMTNSHINSLKSERARKWEEEGPWGMNTQVLCLLLSVCIPWIKISVTFKDSVSLILCTLWPEHCGVFDGWTHGHCFLIPGKLWTFLLISPESFATKFNFSPSYTHTHWVGCLIFWRKRLLIGRVTRRHSSVPTDWQEERRRVGYTPLRSNNHWQHSLPRKILPEFLRFS
jgi:hypothetical protein